MTRFIDVGVARVNASYIVRVEGQPDGSAEVYMIDGTMFHCDHFDYAELDGDNHVVAIVPTEDLDAVYSYGDGKVVEPVKHLCVMASGAVVPIDEYQGGDEPNSKSTLMYYCERG